LLEVLAKGGEPMAEELTTPGPWTMHGRCVLGGDGFPVAVVRVAYRSAAEEEANGRLIATAIDMRTVVWAVAAAYQNDPGTSELDDEQPVSITLGDVRRAWAALAKVDR
jgi:hypothetical protein